MRALAADSIAALTAGLKDEDTAVRIRAAQQVLDRLLGKPTQPHVIEVQAEVEAFQQIVLDAVTEVAVDVRDRIEQRLREKAAGPADGGAAAR